MTLVLLRAPLSELAGGRRHELVGATVQEVLAALEEACPALAGWVLDERGRVRAHVNVYVNGDQAGEEAAVGPADRVHVLPSITGG